MEQENKQLRAQLARPEMERDGFEASNNSWPLRRHAPERRDPGYDAFLQDMLSPEDWAYQQQIA